MSEISLLDTDEHEEVRFVLIKKCEALAVEKPEWAAIFLLFDIGRQIGDLGKDIRALTIAVEGIADEIEGGLTTAVESVSDVIEKRPRD